MKPSLLTSHKTRDEGIDQYSLWCTTYCGVPVLQSWYDLLLWEKFFTACPIESMLEIGTQFGGLSLFFKHHSETFGFEFFTLDIVEFQEAAKLDPLLNSTRLILDCFGTQAMERLSGLAHPIAVLCDGGNKPLEIQTYSRLLSTGDFIAVHDWMQEVGPGDITGLPIEELPFPYGKESFTRFYKVT